MNAVSWLGVVLAAVGGLSGLVYLWRVDFVSGAVVTFLLGLLIWRLGIAF